MLAKSLAGTCKFAPMNRFALIGTALCFMACNSSDKPSDTTNNTPSISIPAINYQVVKLYPHDTANYTQGLELHGDTLYEGTGIEGQSRLRKSLLSSGKLLKEITIPADEFGEGITLFADRIYQLTWQDKRVHVYDVKTLEKTREYEWPYDGWGITNNGKQLIVSTGSSNLYFLDPETFKINSTIGVTDNMGPVANINELEYIDGFVYANVYETNYIVKIDPASGKVVGRLDLTGIRQKNGVAYGPADEQMGFVLNGIAYDAGSKTMLVTGKKWAGMFAIKLL